MYYFAPGSGEKKNHFASLFSLEERGNLITSCRSWLLLSVAQRRAVSQWRESILVSELLSGGCRETVVSSCWGHPVSLCSMLAHPSSSSSKGGPGLAGRVEWRSWCFRENKYCFLVFITSACDYFSPFFFLQYLLTALWFPPGLAILFQTCVLDPLNSRESKAAGFALFLLSKREAIADISSWCLICINVLTFNSSVLFLVISLCCCAYAWGSCCHLSVSVLPLSIMFLSICMQEMFAVILVLEHKAMR